jgi:hypothetical protein
MRAVQDTDTIQPATFDDEKLYLVARIAEDLAPNLATRPQDHGMACQMAWRLVRSYAPSCEAEVLCAARIASLSLTQLEMLRASASPDLTAALKLKLVSTAVALNRSITQAERALARSQRSEDVRRAPLPPLPKSEAPDTDPPADTSLIDLAKRRARLREAVARLEARAAKAAGRLDPDAASARPADATASEPAAPSDHAPPPGVVRLTRPVAASVGPADGRRTQTPRQSERPNQPRFDPAADFRRRTADAHACHHAAPAASPDAHRKHPAGGAAPPPTRG